MKTDIKLYGFKTTDFKGVLAARKKRGTEMVDDYSSYKASFNIKQTLVPCIELGS